MIELPVTPDLAAAHLAEMRDGRPAPVRGTYATMCWLHAVSRAMWTPALLAAIHEDWERLVTSLAPGVAALYPSLRPPAERYWHIGSGRLRQGKWSRADWRTWLAWQSGPPPSQAGLQFILPQGAMPNDSRPLLTSGECRRPIPAFSAAARWQGNPPG